MPILIPSKNIYKKQNTKVRDNRIDRIEVVANEIFINNESEPVLSLPTIDAFTMNENYEGYVSVDITATESGGIKIKNEKFSAGGADWYNQFVNFELEIPIGTKDVTQLYKNLVIVLTRTYSKSPTKQKSVTYTFTHSHNGKEDFNFSVYTVEPEYGVLGLAPRNLVLYIDPSFVSYAKYPVEMNTPNKIKGTLVYSVGVDILQDGDFERVLNTEITFMAKNIVKEGEKIEIVGNLNGEKVHSIKKNELMQTTNTTGGIEEWSMRQGTDYRFEVVEGTNPPITPRAVIDGVRTIIYFLTDKAVKSTKTITLTNGSSYSVGAGVSNYSISGSVLIKEIRGEVDGIVPAITELYEKTKAQYALGKETATIRCSISDYYEEFSATVGGELNGFEGTAYYEFFNYSIDLKDGDIVEINGTKFSVGYVEDEGFAEIFGDAHKLAQLEGETVSAKVKRVAIDNSTGKMSFGIYDKVIPMVYGADGKDRPMSTYTDGTAKVFAVLGTKIYYDGAVWQELSLQEV